MYAIVDIETTGGYAAGNDITEVAIVLHDGQTVVERFETLIRPLAPIPYYIQVLTGISYEMVESAPVFSQVAEKIFALLEGNTFIAHNVNFDYSFLKHHLLLSGFELDCPKLCTVRLARKVFPELSSYSLGNLCRNLNIMISNRHRAGGDADATVRLFELILASGGEQHILKALKRSSREQYLPPHLSKEQIDRLPYCPGVYYFHNQKGKVIYVGKAKNLKYRVSSHFTHNGAGRQRQDFLRNIYSITYQECTTELMAFILESIEIKKLWPEYNRSQKTFNHAFGLYCYEDRNGYIRLVIDKQKKQLPALYTFSLLTEGHRLLNRLIRQFQLCPKLCCIQKSDDVCTGIGEGFCMGACEHQEHAASYNERVEAAMLHLETMLPSFAVVDEGYNREESCCFLIEKGKFYGMGTVPSDVSLSNVEQLKSYLTHYPENDYIRGLIYQFVSRKPEKKIEFNVS